ncbi:FAD-dependent oxidoreductase [Streptomyces qinglanensis]|uniref:FAD-dependent oxidoreductase n=1 Tax=Streptomyces qinglanensis TaxID=943816 RepID=UPI000945DC10|nr:FAD-dependent monooxygenase [Streptomyces qinglanensis]
MGGQRGHAVVIGSGICGLTAARVLTEHFDTVTLLERDTLPDGDERRRGTPQARHVHGLLARGAGHLEDLFPGLRTELAQAGAPVYDHGAGARTRVWAGSLPTVTVGLEVQTAHRDALEGALRRRVAALEKVAVRDATAVTGLHVSEDGTRAEGVSVTPASGGSTEVIEADLVVDASGRNSALPDWLTAAGYPAPKETVVDGGLAYATRTVQVEREQPAQGLQQMNQPPDRPGGVYASHTGGGRWTVTLFGAGGQHPPVDDEGWLACAESLGNEDLDRLLEQSTPVSGVFQYKATANRWRAYAGMRRWPERLVALGDSATAFNPVFGQGMTIAVGQCVALGEALAARGGDPAGLGRQTQRMVARSARIPWLMATSDDLVWSYAMRGARLPLHWRATAWYKQRLLHLATRDPGVVKTFMRVYHMLASPAAMAAPRIMSRVLFAAKSPSPASAARPVAAPRGS